MTKDCEFTFKCSKAWNELEELPFRLSIKLHDEVLFSIKHCNNCDQSVYEIRDDSQLEVAKTNGLCVSLADSYLNPSLKHQFDPDRSEKTESSKPVFWTGKVKR